MAVETKIVPVTKVEVASEETSKGSSQQGAIALSLMKFRCTAPSGILNEGGILSDNKDGTYSLDINAKEPGMHTIDVELDKQPVPGSPFFVRILQAASKENTQIYGPGLESGVLGDYKGLFHVSTKGSGPGNLKVRIQGPKGGFTVQMVKDNNDDRVVNVTFNPSLHGVYVINVFWSGEHVAGSPHEIFIAPDAATLQAWYDDPLVRAKLRIKHEQSDGLVVQTWGTNRVIKPNIQSKDCYVTLSSHEDVSIVAVGIKLVGI